MASTASTFFGADHGARRFRAVIKIIFRKKEDATVSPIPVVVTVGNIDCTKETHDILEKTIAKPINEGLRHIVIKFSLFNVRLIKTSLL